MWIVTDFGFFSVVQKPGDEKDGMLTVRARVKGDLERLREEYLPSLGSITESRTNDYRFRARAPRSDVAAAMAQAVDSIRYDNFKSQVRKTQGAKRETILHGVWHALLQLQKP